MTDLAPLTSRFCSSCGAIFHVGTDDERVMPRHCNLSTRAIPTFEGEEIQRRRAYLGYLGLVGQRDNVVEFPTSGLG